MTKMAFIGLGVMGYPMAGHLAKGGHELNVYNRSTKKSERWVGEFGGKIVTTPRAAAEGAEVIYSCVGNDNDLRSIVYGDDGILAGISPNAVFVDHTTSSAKIAREINAKASEHNINFLDAPVSGGQTGAENGVLTVMVGGDERAFNKVSPFVKCYAQAVTFLGPSGSGQLCKMVNQICIAGLLQGLSEGIAFGQKAGLDMDKVVDVISKGAAQSWQLENRAPTMIKNEFDFGFAVDWMRKDLGICLAEADNNQAQLPVTALVNQFYKEIQKRNGNRWDTSSLIELINK